jgi:hypothetical protein
MNAILALVRHRQARQSNEQGKQQILSHLEIKNRFYDNSKNNTKK